MPLMGKSIKKSDEKVSKKNKKKFINNLINFFFRKSNALLI